MNEKELVNNPNKATKKQLVQFVRRLKHGKITIQSAPDDLHDLSKDELIHLVRVLHEKDQAHRILLQHAYSDLDDYLSQIEDLEPDEESVKKSKASSKRTIEGYS